MTPFLKKLAAGPIQAFGSDQEAYRKEGRPPPRSEGGRVPIDLDCDSVAQVDETQKEIDKVSKLEVNMAWKWCDVAEPAINGTTTDFADMAWFLVLVQAFFNS